MKYVCRGEALPKEYRADAVSKSTDVGAVIPTTVLNQIVEKLESTGMILALVTRTAYKGGVSIPVSTVKPTATWVNEGAGSDKQKKNIAKDGMITFAYHKLRCAVAVSLEVDTMAISAFETLLINNIVEAMTKALEQAIIDGNGTGKPKGILAETPADGQTIESAAPSYSDLIKAEGALPMAYENGAVWCMSKKTFMEYVGMTDKNGQPMHAASDTLKEWLYEWNKYHPDQPLYAIKADIHHYFQSIDHAVLKTEIRKVIKDAGVLALLDRIIDHNGNMPDGVGIPVGNLTSQLFANIYLDALDQFIKHELGVEAYIRYMDDFVILSPDKEQLRSWLARIEQFLREELKLEFNPKTTILAAKNGIDFVGYKHRATHRKVRKDSIKRIKRTIKKCESGKITKEQLQKSIQSWTGHAGHADSYNLRKKIETLAEAAIEKAA